MTRYALILYASDGVYHYVGLANEDKTLEQAIDVALETIYGGELSRDYDDLDFEIVEVANIHHYNTAGYKEYFDKKEAASRKKYTEQQDRNDKDQFERLKKKFDKKD